MAEQCKHQLTLYQPAVYQITVPGHLDPSWVVWDKQITMAAKREEDGTPVTILTGTLDQAALQGFLRRLYALGLPLISVIHIKTGTKSRKSQS